MPLNDIEDVRAEDRGIFGAKDMLLRSRPGAERAEITVEIKRSANDQEWQAFRQAKAGGNEPERQ